MLRKAQAIVATRARFGGHSREAATSIGCRAVAALDTQKDAETSFAEALSKLGAAWRADHEQEFRLGDEGALAAFDKATKLKADYADAWYWKGLALAMLDRDEEAVAANEQVLRYRPKDTETWLHKAVALSKLERYAEALGAYEEVLSLWPDDIAALFRKAEALRKTRTT